MFRIWTAVDRHVDVEAQTIEPHEEWRRDVYEGHDIAVVILKNPPRDNVSTVRIRPQPGWSGNGAPPKLWDRQALTILGWGQTDSYGGSAQALQVAAVQYRSANWRCKREFSKVDPDAGIVLEETMMCVEPLGGSQTCKGDSGGPLILKGDTWHEARTSRSGYFHSEARIVETASLQCLQICTTMRPISMATAFGSLQWHCPPLHLLPIQPARVMFTVMCNFLGRISQSFRPTSLPCLHGSKDRPRLRELKNTRAGENHVWLQYDDTVANRLLTLQDFRPLISFFRPLETK